MSPVVVALVALGALAAPAYAQVPDLQRVDVDLWPEYDQPAVLVMYKATLAPSTPLPAQVRLSIPAAVGAPHAVAYRDLATGQLMLAHYQTTADGVWQHLDIAAPSTSLRVEYYAPVASDDQARAFSLEWPGTSSVGELAYSVQQPAGSDLLSITPEPLTTTVEDTLAYHQGSLGALGSGQSASLQVRYQKTDPRLTTQILQASQPAAAPAPPPPPTVAPPVAPAPRSGMTAIMWISLVLGLALIGVLIALGWSWRKR